MTSGRKQVLFVQAERIQCVLILLGVDVGSEKRHLFAHLDHLTFY